MDMEDRYTELSVGPDRQIAGHPPHAWQTTREWVLGGEARANITNTPTALPGSPLPFCPCAILPVGQTRPRLLTTHNAKPNKGSVLDPKTLSS